MKVYSSCTPNNDANIEQGHRYGLVLNPVHPQPSWETAVIISYSNLTYGNPDPNNLQSLPIYLILMIKDGFVSARSVLVFNYYKRIVDPKDVHIPISGTCEHGFSYGKKNIINMIKNLVVEKSSWLSGWVKASYKWKAERQGFEEAALVSLETQGSAMS